MGVRVHEMSKTLAEMLFELSENEFILWKTVRDTFTCNASVPPDGYYTDRHWEGCGKWSEVDGAGETVEEAILDCYYNWELAIEKRDKERQEES